MKAIISDMLSFRKKVIAAARGKRAAV